MKTDLRVISYQGGMSARPDELLIDTTSRSMGGGAKFSPFFLGPIGIDGEFCQNMENYWQYSKVYKEHLNSDGDPTREYWKWRRQGFAKNRADKYPMGKGAIPEFSVVYRSPEKHLGYIEARKEIYVPIYKDLILQQPAFYALKEFIDAGVCRCVYLMDFDGYDHVGMKKSFADVLNDPDKKMGHAFVLWALLTGELSWAV